MRKVGVVVVVVAPLLLPFETNKARIFFTLLCSVDQSGQ